MTSAAKTPTRLTRTLPGQHIRGFNDFVLEQLGLSGEAPPAGPPRPSA